MYRAMYIKRNTQFNQIIWAELILGKMLSPDPFGSRTESNPKHSVEGDLRKYITNQETRS